jgi:hypothetical protein
MKQCAHCKEFKAVEEFAYSNRLLGTRQKHCRRCMSQFNKTTYPRHTEEHKERVRKRKAARKEASKRYVWDYLSDHPCEICGQSDPRLLEFDHIVPKQKKHNVSELSSGGYSLETVKEEIDKCRVLCVVCHRLKTYDEVGWFVG